MIAMSGSLSPARTGPRDISHKTKTPAEAADTVFHASEPPQASKPVKRNATHSVDPARNRWPRAVIASVAMHAAIGAAMMAHWSFAPNDETAPPAAMMVELAVMPSSPPVTPSEIPPGPEQVEAAPKPTPLDKLRFEPPPQVDPALRPEFALPVQKQAKPVETQVVANDARQTTAPPSIQAVKQDRNVAPVEGNNVAPPSDAEQAWETRILAKLERNKRYPSAAQSAGQQDTVILRLVIDRRGMLVDAALKKSAGYVMLDSETLSLARRASPFPVPPDSVVGDRIVRLVPIAFYIKKRR